MQLINEFTVGVPIEVAWAVLTDLERIAPCLPGAQLLEVSGDEHVGVVTVKVGPITTKYEGAVRLLDRDAPRRAVLRAEGREPRGHGAATATITAVLEPIGEGTTVVVETDLHVTGRVAQFGRGVLAEVSAKLLTRFVERLETTVLKAEGEAPDISAPPPVIPSEPSALPAARVAGVPVAKQVAPGAGGLLVTMWLLRGLVRRTSLTDAVAIVRNYLVKERVDVQLATDRSGAARSVRDRRAVQPVHVSPRHAGSPLCDRGHRWFGVRRVRRDLHR